MSYFLLSSPANWNFALFDRVISCSEFLWSVLSRQKRETGSLVILKEILLTKYCFHGNFLHWVSHACFWQWWAAVLSCIFTEIWNCVISLPAVFHLMCVAIYLWVLVFSYTLYCVLCKFYGSETAYFICWPLNSFVLLYDLWYLYDLLFIIIYLVTLSTIIRFSTFHITIDFVWIYELYWITNQMMYYDF